MEPIDPKTRAAARLPHGPLYGAYGPGRDLAGVWWVFFEALRRAWAAPGASC